MDQVRFENKKIELPDECFLKIPQPEDFAPALDKGKVSHIESNGSLGMGQILSSSEIDAILSGLDFTSAEPKSTPDIDESASGTDMTFYDFEHPIPLRPSQLDALRLASANVSQTLQAGLAQVLFTSVAVNLIGVEQSTYRDYLATAEQPACLAVFESATTSDLWLLDISRSLAFTMIDCLLGGNPEDNQPPVTLTRPFTDVEIRLIERALQTIYPNFVRSISNQQTLRMTRLTSDSSLISSLASNEAVALVSFDVTCGPSRGIAQLCIPWKQVSQDSQFIGMDNDELQKRMKTGAMKLPVMAIACMARLKLATRDLASLNPGDVILTDASPASGISLEVDGREIFRGTPGQIHGKKVIRLTNQVHGDHAGNA